VLKLLFKHKEVDPFLEPVDWQGLGLDDYPEVVTHPMDLNAVQARLERGGYADVLEAAADVELIWSNSMLYNPAENWVYQAAVEMKQYADLKLAPIVASAKARLEATSAAVSAAVDAVSAAVDAVPKPAVPEPPEADVAMEEDGRRDEASKEVPSAMEVDSAADESVAVEDANADKLCPADVSVSLQEFCAIAGNKKGGPSATSCCSRTWACASQPSRIRWGRPRASTSSRNVRRRRPRLRRRRRRSPQWTR
jgi:hypothetical protein